MSPLGVAGGGSCRIPARPAAGVEGKGQGGRLEAHLRAIWVLGRGGEPGGELARGSRTATAATIRIPARMRRAPGNVRRLKLQGVLGETLGW
jgi:hypothetical protein